VVHSDVKSVVRLDSAGWTSIQNFLSSGIFLKKYLTHRQYIPCVKGQITKLIL